jgi:F-type H+-transporting ATPase subunit epsilon
MALPTHIRLEFVTPDRTIIHDDVDEVVLPGEEGDFGVLPGHARCWRCCASGRCGTARARTRRSRSSRAASPKWCGDRVTVLAQIAERAEDIDLARAEAAKHRAEQTIAKPPTEMDHELARIALMRAVTRLEVSKHARIRNRSKAWRPFPPLCCLIPACAGTQTKTVFAPGRISSVPRGRWHGGTRSRRSRLAPGRAVIETFISDTRHADINTTWPFPYESDAEPRRQPHDAAFRLANRRLGAAMENDEKLRGMATTAAAVLVGRDKPVVAHVGDSRVYIFRDGTLTQITEDHSWVNEQVRAACCRSLMRATTRGGMSSRARCLAATTRRRDSGDRRQSRRSHSGVFGWPVGRRAAGTSGGDHRRRHRARRGVPQPDRGRQSGGWTRQHHGGDAAGRCGITSRT